jgi:hypothetical protein
VVWEEAFRYRERALMLPLVARCDDEGSGIRAVRKRIGRKTAACVTADTPNAPPKERRTHR